MRKQLSPPFLLKEYAKWWIAEGFPLEHCVEQVRKHLDTCGHQYRVGSGDKGIEWIDGIIRMTLRSSNPRPDGPILYLDGPEAFLEAVAKDGTLRDEKASTERQLDELQVFLGTIGNLYVRKQLSPPFSLKDYAMRWMADGIPLEHCVEQVRKHLDTCGHQYRVGSGDKGISWVDQVIRRTWQSSNPRPDGPVLAFDDAEVS